VVHDGKFKSIPKSDNVLDIELDRAVELLAQKKKSSRGSNEIKDLGKHPDTDKPIKVMTGRYGPYLKHGKKNISLPKGEAPEDFNMSKAIDLIKEKG
jgi:DNA topoisomerase-1